MYDDSIKEYKTDIEINVIKWIESYRIDCYFLLSFDVIVIYI